MDLNSLHTSDLIWFLLGVIDRVRAEKQATWAWALLKTCCSILGSNSIKFCFHNSSSTRYIIELLELAQLSSKKANKLGLIINIVILELELELKSNYIYNKLIYSVYIYINTNTNTRLSTQALESSIKIHELG